MKLPSSFRSFLRKIARYAGPVGATTMLRGCPCPAAVEVAPKVFTQSIATTNNMTLESTAESWANWCTAVCSDMSTTCHLHIATSEGNSMPVGLSCGDGYPTAASESAATWISVCKKACGDEQDCVIGPSDSIENKPLIECTSWWLNCAGGRRTAGIEMVLSDNHDHAAVALAKMAALEAESIPAFRRLARELKALGAPRSLHRRAARSRQDEQRHARTMASLARRRGANISSTNLSDKILPLRSLEEVALENAVEGCVRETYGAWLAWRQSENARDPELRATMRRIAMDEARHASLAWDIHEWAMKRVDSKARQRIRDEMQKEQERIAATQANPLDPAAIELGIVALKPIHPG